MHLRGCRHHCDNEVQSEFPSLAQTLSFEGYWSSNPSSLYMDSKLEGEITNQSQTKGVWPKGKQIELTQQICAFHGSSFSLLNFTVAVHGIYMWCKTRKAMEEKDWLLFW